MSAYTVFPRIVYAVTVHLEHWARANTNRGQILNEGEYNYVEHSNLNSLADTRGHCIQKTASSFVSNSFLLTENQKRSSSLSSRVANTSAVSWEMQKAVSGALQLCVYCACASCENYTRAIIISLVGNNAVNTILGQIQFKGEIYWRKCGIYVHVLSCIAQLKMWFLVWKM